MHLRYLAASSFVICAVFTASAQTPKPQGAAPGVKEVLYSAADSIGMLRTAAEVDRIATMNYWATGTMTADGKACKVKEYKASAGGKAAVTVENGRTVLSFPVADVPGATIRATYSQDTYLLERVEARLGATALDISYTDYGDWNGDDYLSDVQFPKRIVQKRGNATVLDLTVTKTKTYNPYVVMPVPPAIKAQR